eukprot:CAMPEP_0201550820 /NCGR_PEP_ID=MMETSP0173_2-20130828/7115_1 /ASSEMBLY_ACC=CAM_ASM_000268 /TAXON_ID=218659 /ORGANISM="Vexillifera sp., Strain DIVA3 564/2" /LENGTH=244 /DNA_ID=CAMNT_0047960907 /DNA_START=442 /DNA_END=1177 /DNA_ORIENTATION=+
MHADVLRQRIPLPDPKILTNQYYQPFYQTFNPALPTLKSTCFSTSSVALLSQAKSVDTTIQSTNGSESTFARWKKYKTNAQFLDYFDLQGSCAGRVDVSVILKWSCKHLLDWWSKGLVHSSITEQAKYWLTFLPSAAASESVWSKVGHIWSNRRGKLSTEKVSALTSLSYLYQEEPEYVKKTIVPSIAAWNDSSANTNGGASSSAQGSRASALTNEQRENALNEQRLFFPENTKKRARSTITTS